MAYLSKIQLPSGNVYDLKDASVWTILGMNTEGTSSSVIQNILSRLQTAEAGGVTIAKVTNAADTPEGVKWISGTTEITGTWVATDTNAANKIIFVPSTNGNMDIFDEYMVVTSGSTQVWEKIGNTDVDLSGYALTSDLGTLAFKSTIALDKKTAGVLGANATFKATASTVTRSGGSSDVALGETTTFTNAESDVTFTGTDKKEALGSEATFTFTAPTVKPATTYIKATASGATITNSGTQGVIPNYTITEKKLTTTSTNNYCNNTGSIAPPEFSATVSNNETLVLSWTDAVMPAFTNLTVATGALSEASATSNVGGQITSSVVPGTEVTVLTDVTVSQPTIKLETTPTSTEFTVQVGSTGNATVQGGSVAVDSKDAVAAIVDLGTAKAAAQTITVGTNDKVTAITGLGTLTAPAQEISVNSADEKTVLLSTTDITVS